MVLILMNYQVIIQMYSLLYIMDFIIDIIDFIGFNSPNILIVINTICLFKQQKYLLLYFVFYGIDYLIIGILKDLIKQPRPSEFLDKKYYDGIDYSKVNHYGLPSAYYGMPSGHCGLSFYSVMFLWLVNKSTNILILELTISLLTIYHRLKYKKHTLEQLIAGAILGCSVALIAYKVGNRLFAYNSPVLNRFLSK